MLRYPISPRVVPRRPIVLVGRPMIVRRTPVPVVKASLGIEEVSYLVGKGIILFTLYYCGLNWLHYKKLREKDEEK